MCIFFTCVASALVYEHGVWGVCSFHADWDIVLQGASMTPCIHAENLRHWKVPNERK